MKVIIKSYPTFYRVFVLACKREHPANVITLKFSYLTVSADNMQQFLTLAERQYIIKHELDSMRAMEDQRIPGIPAPKGKLKARESICECLYVDLFDWMDKIHNFFALNVIKM